MLNNLASDIITLILCITSLAYTIFLMFFCYQWRELEYNRMWKSRLSLISISIVYITLFFLSNIGNIFSKINSDTINLAICDSLYFVIFGIMIPYILFFTRTLIVVAADTGVFETPNPNQYVFFKTSNYLVPPFFISLICLIVDLILSGKSHILSSFDRNECICCHSTISASLYFIESCYCMISLIVLFIKERKYSNIPPLIKSRVFKIPFVYIIFIASAIFAEIRNYIEPIKGHTIYFNLVSYFLTITGITIFLFVFIHFPLLESIKAPIKRGSITPRHGKRVERV